MHRAMFASQRCEGVATKVLWIGTAVVLFLVATALGSSSTSNPGLKIRVSRAGLDYAASVAVEVLSERVKGVKIPDLKNSAHVSIGRVEYEITNIKVTDFVRPSSSVVLNPRSGLSWRMDGAGLSLHGDWRYRYKRRFVRVRDHGRFDGSLNGAAISVSVSLSMDTSSSGRPTMTSVDCSCTIDAVKMRVHGGASWIYRLFMGSVERPLKAQLQRLVCEEARKAVDEDGRSELDKLKVRVPVGDSWLFDYRFVDAPRVDPDFIEFFHKGTFFHKDDSSEPPFQPEPFPAVESERMVIIWVSDYVAQTVGYAIQRHGSLRYHLSRDTLPEPSGDYFSTTCTSGLCLGSILPQVSRVYPNASVEIELATPDPPRVEISPRSIRGTVVSLVTFSAKLSNGTLVQMFRANLTVSVGIAVSIIDSVLRGNVTGFVPSVSVLDTKIGPISAPLLQIVLRTAVGKYVLPEVKKVVWNGVPLPTFDDFQLVDPRLEMHSHCLVVSTDVRYTRRGV